MRPGFRLNPKTRLHTPIWRIVFLNEGEPRRTIELLTQAINLDPKHAYEYDFLSWVGRISMLGDNDAAIEWFLKSLEKIRGSRQPYAFLAMAYALKGEAAKARAAAAEVRRLDPSMALSSFGNVSCTLPSTKNFLRASLFQRGARQGCRSRSESQGRRAAHRIVSRRRIAKGRVHAQPKSAPPACRGVACTRNVRCRWCGCGQYHRYPRIPIRRARPRMDLRGLSTHWVRIVPSSLPGALLAPRWRRQPIRLGQHADSANRGRIDIER